MRRHLLFFVFLVTCSITSVCGQVTRVDYDSCGDPSGKDRSYFFRVGRQNKHGNFYDSLHSWYTATAKLRSVEFRDLKGRPVGNFKTFYPDGKLKSVGRYEQRHFKVYQSVPDSTEQIILEFYSPAGRPLVRHGEGALDGPVDVLREQGRIERGVREGIWKCWYPTGKLYYQESWHDGELVDGISYDISAKEFYYTGLLTEPEPVEGFSQFYEKVVAQVHYPKEAERRGIAGKVMIEFEVDADGIIQTPKVIRGIGYGCDEEAVRVLTLSPPWKPALRRGQPIKNKTSITYIFKLT